MIASYEIILAEDNSSDAELTRRALRKVGMDERLLLVDDGEELLDYIFAKGKYQGRNLTESPCLIMMDLKMPRISGVEALREIRNGIHCRYVPVVLFTSSKEEEDVHMAYKAGVNSFVVKPLDFDDYIKTLIAIGNYWLTINRYCR